MTLSEIQKKAFRYAKVRSVKEDIESPFDIVAMCRHATGEIFEVIDAWTKWRYVCENGGDFNEMRQGQDAYADEIADVIMCMLIIAQVERVDVQSALEKCLLQNRKRALEERNE